MTQIFQISPGVSVVVRAWHLEAGFRTPNPPGNRGELLSSVAVAEGGRELVVARGRFCSRAP